MTLITAMRALHVVVGVAGLTLGAVGMWSQKKGSLHPRVGDYYFVAITASCLSALFIAISEWNRLWFFVFLAVGTYAFAVVGYAAGKRRKGRWLVVHVVGMASSYCGLAMAFLVGRFGMVRMVPSLSQFPLFVRLAPLMFVSTGVVAWTGYEVYRGKLPRS